MRDKPSFSILRRRMHSKEYFPRVSPGSIVKATATTAAFYSATIALAAAEEYAQIVNRWYPSEVLQVEGGGAKVGQAPTDAANAQWSIQLLENGEVALKNRATNMFLSRKGDQLSLSTNAVGWTPEFIDDIIRFRGSGSDEVVDRPGAGVTKVQKAPDANWSAQWLLRYDSVPEFAIKELNQVQDWAAIGSLNRDRLLLAALAMNSAPDNKESLNLKARWARTFPYGEKSGNTGSENILLTGEPLERYSETHNSQTVALYSSGRYAWPAEPITITVPRSMVSKGFFLQIGHLDGNRSKNSPFVRYPFSLVVKRNIDAEKITLTNGFGGAIYIGGSAGFDPAGAWVNVSGGDRMPIFKLGDTGVEGWRKQIRAYRAPWAEIQSGRFIVTLPSKFVRDLDSPDRIAAYWDSVLRHQDELVGIDGSRKAADRGFIDIDTPPGIGGYAGGRSVTAPIGWVDAYLHPGKDWWGWYHEIGHNHQAPVWNEVGSTTELSNNIMLLYAYGKMHRANFNQTIEASGPSAPPQKFSEIVSFFELSPVERQKSWTASGANNDYAISKPFEKLTLFGWLSERFGWDVFKTAFHAYEASGFPLPQNALAQTDTLMVELSKASGFDLADYFEFFGQPVAADARQKTASLPKWRPESGKAIGFDLRFTATDFLADDKANDKTAAMPVRYLKFHDGANYSGDVLWMKGGGSAALQVEFNPSCGKPCRTEKALLIGVKGQEADGAALWPTTETLDRKDGMWRLSKATLEIPATPGAYEISAVEFDAKDSSGPARAKADKFQRGETIGLVVVTP